jgi:ankyrin repeat protein
MTWAVVQARGLVIQPRPWSTRDPDTRPLELLAAAGALLGLREAVILNDVDMARWLCNNNTLIDVSASASFSFDDTFLMLAAELGSPEMVNFLLDRGADIEGTNDLGLTALMRAAESGHADIVARLLDLGADINCGWPDETALSMAEVHNHQEIASLLLSRKAKRRLVDAVDRDDIQLAKELLDQGADPEAELVLVQREAKDHDLESCRWDRLLVHAVSRGNVEMVRMLLDYGAIIEKQYGEYRTPLEEAARCGHANIVRILISYGADMNAVGLNGITALDWAIRIQHDEMVELLGLAGRKGAGGE